MMKSIGFTLFLVGAASTVLYFFDYNLMVLSWINHWGETTSWGIRGALVFVGGGILFLQWLAGDGDDEGAGDGGAYLHSETLNGGGGSADPGIGA